MNSYTIAEIGEPILRKQATLVTEPSGQTVRETVATCITAMHDADLAGFAAPQIGISERIFITEIRETKYRTGTSSPLTTYINPEITSRFTETSLGWEGCGSIPGIFGQVERSERVTVTFTDQSGEVQSLEAGGLLARVIQHEYDHLEGVLFTDRADPRTFVSHDYYITHKSTMQ